MAWRLANRATGFVFGFSVLLLLVSCGPKEEAQQPPPPEAPVVQAPPPPVETPQDVAAKAEPVESRIKRNPFLSHLVIAKGTEEKERKGPLECCELNVFRVVAVVVNPQASFALVQAPDNKRYIVRKGDSMGTRDGRITRIDTKGITVREYMKDGKGRVISTLDTELKLPEKGFSSPGR